MTLLFFTIEVIKEHIMLDILLISGTVVSVMILAFTAVDLVMEKRREWGENY